MFKQLFHSLRNQATMRAAPGSGGAGGCSGTITADEALQGEDARYAAQTSNDFAAMERLFGEDLVYIHSNGLLDTKAGFIELLRSGTVKYRIMKRSEVKVRTYGCLAIITGRASFEVTARGQDVSPRMLFHAIWAKRAGGVQFVSWQATSLPPSQ